MSCCSCGNNCQSGCGCRVLVLPDNPVEAYGMVNINTLGIGVYDSTDGTTFQMRGIYSANASLTVTLDAANGAILLTLDVGSIIDDLPQATTTQRGVGETATDAEAIAKASTTVFVTPSNFAAMASSQTFAGFIEIATNAEALAGASALLAITPASLAAVVATLEQTTTFADSVARAAAVPAFEGQFGAQVDINQAFVSFGVAAGNWNGILTLGVNNVTVGDTTVDLNGGFIQFHSGGFNLAGSTTNTWQGNYSIDNAVFTFTGVATIDYDDVIIQIGGVSVPAASVMTTAGLGIPSSALISTFLSSANTDTGWTNFTNSLVRKTGDCNTITLPELAQVVDTLIQTLGSSLLTPVP